MQLQHGDVLLEEVEGIPVGAKQQKKGIGIILAEGETTGHAHRVKGSATLYTGPDGSVYLKPDAETDLTHEEHKTIRLMPVAYRVRRVQEFDYLEQQARQVQD